MFSSVFFLHTPVPESVDHDLAEIARVLKSNGICMITYYLLNPASERGIEAGWSTNHFPFVYGSEVCRVAKKDNPEHVVAYDENFIRRHLSETRTTCGRAYCLWKKWWWGDAGDLDMVKGVKKSNRSTSIGPN